MPLYIEYYLPGTIVADKHAVEVQTREIDKLDIPPRASSFRFFESESATGAQRNKSKLYMLAEEVLNEEQVKQKIDNPDTLLWNMRANGYKYIACTRRGTCHFVDENTIVVNAEKELVHGSDGINRISAAAVDKSLVTSEPISVSRPLKLKTKNL